MSCAFIVIIFTGCTLPPVGTVCVMQQEQHSKPSRIVVYDMFLGVAEIPPDAPMGARMSTGPGLTPEQLAKDRELSAKVTVQLVNAMRNMGLPAERALPTRNLQVEEVVVRGCFASLHEGSGEKRYTVGFDRGASELLTMVETFQITPQGIGQTLASKNNPSGVIATTGIKVDSDASGRLGTEEWSRRTVAEIMANLKPVFREQGWIN